ncbi:hypothetical protein AVEN_91875-1 [Araneus ventricosus]|uniref:Uncharacterized protein n=1 Tax=Araneus ventricosus TaxID=182803 RepID=A0A4Y2G4Y2_ARAVE|nr:hypothetical protein AVEN_91875-1 [Araneus ventricosus]
MEYGYNTQATDSAGARIAIHDSAELPDLESSGLSITPGFETSISLRQTLIHRLPSPYKDRCVHYKTSNRYNQTDQNDCVYSCIQGWSNKICGCADPRLPNKDGFMYCDVTNASQSSCLKFIFESVTVRETCDCPLPCISKAYNEITSQAVWPAENSFRRNSFQEMDQFRKSHARVKVYYATLERSVFHQKPMFQESELFSHLGGELGLWLGLSLIALFEVMESLICFLKFLVRCCCKPKKELFY